MAHTIEVKILKDGVVLGDRVLRKGELAAVARPVAWQLAREGRAAHTVRVKVTVEQALFGSAVRNRGDCLDTDPETARRWFNEGAVEIDPQHRHKVDATLLTGPKAPPTPDPPPDPGPTVRVIVKRPFLYGRAWREEGETLVVPETPGLAMVKAGTATLSAAGRVAETVKSLLAAETAGEGG
jgi:hypothetical protein